MLSPTPVTFKANTLSPMFPALEGMSALAVRGRDAAAFLQAQLMNDVAALVPGRWHWNGWLNPKGRLIALFALAKIGEEEFLALLPDFPAAELQARLQRYVFRSKLVLEVRDDLKCAADFTAPPHEMPESRDQILACPDAVLCLDMGAEGGERRMWLLPAASPRLAPSDATSQIRWDQLDLVHGLPRLAAGQSEAWTPQMLSLERLHAFSLKKGCYPGQEIVARTHYLGKTKRGPARLRGTGLSAGASIKDASGQDVGEVVFASGDEALAVLVQDPGRSLQSDGQPLETLAFLDGLQRPV